MTIQSHQIPDQGPIDEIALAYAQRWGELPGWLVHLAPPARARVLQVAVSVGMRLTDTDWHLLEDMQAGSAEVPAQSAGVPFSPIDGLD